MRIAVLGGGISGLSLAYFLKSFYGKRVEVHLFEKSNRCGGWIQTIQKDGFDFELGPRGFRPSGAGIATCHLVERLHIEEQLAFADSSAKTRYVYSKGKLRPLSLLSPFLLKALPGILLEPFRKKGEDVDESIASFIERRFGRYVLQNLFDPLVSGIYAGSPSKLSIEACFPSLFKGEKEKGSVVKAMLFGKKESSKWGSIPLLSFKKGMGTLPTALSKHLKENLFLEEEIQALQQVGKEVEVTTDQRTAYFDQVFSTLPLKALSRVLPRPTSYFNEIPHTSLAVLSFGFHKLSMKKKGFGYLVPSSESDGFLGMVWDSQVFPDQKGNHRLTCMFGGMHFPEILTIGKENLLKKGKAILANHLGIKNEPDAWHLSFPQEAIAQYPVHFFARRNQALQLIKQEFPGLTLLGSGLFGAAINDCIAKAQQVAEDLKVDHRLPKKEFAV